MELPKTLAVEVDDVDDFPSESDALFIPNDKHQNTVIAQRVQCSSSPFFYAFYKLSNCTILS